MRRVRRTLEWRFTGSVVDNENPLADFPFNKLPTELLVKIFHHARTNSVLDACKTKYPYPVALAQVCRHWRNVALCAPTLWTDIRLVQYDTEETRKAARIYLERSKTCPIFLTWFSDPDQPYANIQRVIHDLIIPGAERWQRITLLAGNNAAADALLTAMESLDFPILQDVEISSTTDMRLSNPTLCRSAPLLRRCRFRSIPSFPPLPSNLVVLDCKFLPMQLRQLDLDPLLEFLPHVAHSLEHLRFGPPSAFMGVRFTPRTSRIPLEHLKSLLIDNSRVIMDHIFTPNLTHFVASYRYGVTDAAKVLEGFSAPMLRSIRFHDAPLLPLLDVHFPSIFPRLESITFSGRTDELASALQCEALELRKSSSWRKAPRRREVQRAFPNLKEFMILDTSIWKYPLEKKEAAEVIMSHLHRWLPGQGTELILCEPGEVSVSIPDQFQEDSCEREARLFVEVMMRKKHWDPEFWDSCEGWMDWVDHEYQWSFP